MKKFIAGFIIGIIIAVSVSAFAITRDDIYARFGPKLIEGVIELVRGEINEIRQHIGLPQKSEEEFINNLDDKEKKLKEYNWMKKSNARNN